jgi:hypothetical protein
MIVFESGNRDAKVETYLGGPYSFWESLRKGGIGSVKIIYLNGLEKFDAVAEASGASNLCNLHLYKAGFAIRFIKQNQSAIAAIRHDELRQIHFITTPILAWTGRKKVIRYEAHLVLHLADHSIQFKISPTFYNPFKSFLRKHFNHEVLYFEENPLT